MAASTDVVEGVLRNLMHGDVSEANQAAMDLEYLVSSSKPKGHLSVGMWEWSQNGATANRLAFGSAQGLYESLLILIENGGADAKAKACGAMSKLGFRNDANVLAIIKHPGMLDKLTELLNHRVNAFGVQVQAWRLLQNCVSSSDEVKVILCRNKKLLDYLRAACTSSMVWLFLPWRCAYYVL